MFAAHRLSFCLLCWVMAWITPLAPSLVVYAQETGQAANSSTALPLEYLAPNSAAILSVRPRQVLTSEAAQMMPVEVVSAACLKELGFDPLVIKSLLVSATPPLAGPPNYAIAIELTKHIDLATLSPKLTAHTVPAEFEGNPYLKSQHPVLPSICWVGNTTMLIAPQQTLVQILSNEPGELAPFAKELAAGSADDLQLLVNVAMLRPLIQMGLMQAASEIPPELQGLLELPNHIQQVRAKISISGAGPLELSCEANDSQAANRAEELIDETMSFYRKSAAQQAAKMLQSEDPVEQAIGRYTMRVAPAWTEQFTPTRNGNRFTLFELPADENALGGTTSIAVIGVLVGLLLPAVQAAREAARHNVSANNMRQLMLALHKYDKVNRHFPAHANYDSTGKPLLSWRVHILPYLDHNELYMQFRLDEPWDSDHNRQLIGQMPSCFFDPSSKLKPQAGRTHYLGALGDRFIFFDTESPRMSIVYLQAKGDGTARTIALLQVNDETAVPWTKPEDWKMDPNNRLRGLTPNLHPGTFLVAFANGSVRGIHQLVDPNTLEYLLTFKGGEAVDLDNIPTKNSD